MKLHTALISTLLLTAPTFAQDDAAEAEPFVLPAGEMTITGLVDACASHLDWNILYNEQEIASAAPGGNKSKLQRQVVTDSDGCEELLYSLLYRHGFAVVPLDPARDVYEVILMAGPRGREVANRATHKPVEQILARPNLKVPVITVVRLEHINAQLANNALRPFFASNSGGYGANSLSIGNVGNAQSLLLQGFQDQVAQAIRMIGLCDIEQPAQDYHGQPLPDYIARLEQRIKKLENRLEKLIKQAK
ncbi:MAG: hypothetical protein KAI24_00075 [Planctomycetes bacterium]|nr:hypothetical protein [Planctomycetota bacterium]